MYLLVHAPDTSVTFTLRRPYGGRRIPKSSDSCGCRRNSAVAAGPPYGESLCFTGHKGGRRIIARSYNFFHFYVRRRNLTRRSHAVDASTATVRRMYGGRTEAMCLPCGGPRVIWLLGTPRSPYGPLARAPCVCLNICHKNYGCRRDALRRPCVITSKDVGQPQFFCLHKLKMRRTAAVANVTARVCSRRNTAARRP